MPEERVALVLGGGGLKGLAHVGAWRAVQESGIRVTEVVGTSIGALIGAAIAGGVEHERLSQVAHSLQKAEIISLNRWALLFNGIRQESIFRGDVFLGYIEATLPVAAFDDLALPLSVNAVDLGTGEPAWFGAGGRGDVSLTDAVYASCALPVFYPPARLGDRYYVDGGVCDPLPVSFALARGADRVIAVDVAAAIAGDAAGTVAKGMVAIHHRTMQIMGGSRSMQERAEGYGPNVTYVRPALDGYDTFDFGNTDYFLAEGYRATRAALGGGEDAELLAV
ncbi:MAG: patatin-like phospholipase family protein [Gemmatimonadota bacterium]